MFYPDPKLHLKLPQLQLLRQHLFGDSAAALSDRLSDVELVQLLIVSIGQQTVKPTAHEVMCTWLVALAPRLVV